MISRSQRLWAPLVGCALLAGCATIPGEPDPRDPLERMNRSVYKFNETVDGAVFRPIAQIYVGAVPQPVRSCVSNFFSNLGDVWSSFNSFLQGRVPDGINSMGRVLMNTTIGGLGCFDRASEVGVARVPNDFGTTLGVWGVGSGPYLVLPIVGPSTFRDGAGLAVDVYYGAAQSYINDVPVRNMVWGAAALNARANLLEAGDLLDQLALDPYSFVRDAYLQRRQRRIAGDSEELPDYSLPDYDDPEDGWDEAPSDAAEQGGSSGAAAPGGFQTVLMSDANPAGGVTQPAVDEQREMPAEAQSGFRQRDRAQ